MRCIFSPSLLPMPVSISTVCLPVRTSTEFRPVTTRFMASACSFFCHKTLGTMPKKAPPSRKYVLSEKTVSSKSPSLREGEFIGDWRTSECTTRGGELSQCKPDAGQLKQRQTNTQEEVNVVGGSFRWRGREPHAAGAEQTVERALLAQHEIGDGTMEGGNQQPQEQTG